MSVLAINRSLSELEYYHHAMTLYEDMVKLLLRNFGVKAKKNEKLAISAVEKAAVVEAFPYMEPAFQRMDQLESAATLREYSGWLINHYRTEVITQLEALLNNIMDAYLSKAETRETYKQEALHNCEKLIQVMQRLLRVLPVDVNKLLPYLNEIDREIELIKEQL